MGKAARERARRRAEAEAPPKLIVVEDPKPAPAAEPQTFETPTATKEPWMCRVKGCVNLALERHDGPDGVVWLCGSCGRVARNNLALAAAREAFTEQVAELHRPAQELYVRMGERIYGEPKARAAR